MEPQHPSTSNSFCFSTNIFSVQYETQPVSHSPFYSTGLIANIKIQC